MSAIKNKAGLVKKPVAKVAAKPAKVAKAVEVEEEFDAEVETAEEVEEADETEEAEEAAPVIPTAVAANKPIPVADANPEHKKSWVRCAVLRDVSPAPKVGIFDVGRELKCTGLRQGQEVKLPPHVALVLVDSSLVMIVGGNSAAKA